MICINFINTNQLIVAMPKKVKPVERSLDEGLRFEDAVKLIECSDIYQIRFYSGSNTEEPRVIEPYQWKKRWLAMDPRPAYCRKNEVYVMTIDKGMPDKDAVEGLVMLLGVPSQFSWTRWATSRFRYDRLTPLPDPTIEEAIVTLNKNKNSERLRRPRFELDCLQTSWHPVFGYQLEPSQKRQTTYLT